MFETKMITVKVTIYFVDRSLQVNKNFYGALLLKAQIKEKEALFYYDMAVKKH